MPHRFFRWIIGRMLGEETIQFGSFSAFGGRVRKQRARNLTPQRENGVMIRGERQVLKAVVESLVQVGEECYCFG